MQTAWLTRFMVFQQDRKSGSLKCLAARPVRHYLSRTSFFIRPPTTAIVIQGWEHCYDLLSIVLRTNEITRSER